MLDIFAGEQMVVVGRYKTAGKAKIVISGTVGDQPSKTDFPADLIQSSGDQSFAFVEKLWAMRRVGEIIDDLDLNGKNQELVNELVALATKHGILTPYTSFLADETSNVRELANVDRMRGMAMDSLGRLSEAEGRSGVAQRSGKKNLQDSKIADSGAQFGFSAGDGFGMSGGGMGGLGGGGMGGGGMGSGRGGAAPAPGAPASNPVLSASTGGAVYLDASDKAVVVNTVQSVGKQTLYKRGNLWIAENAKNIDPDKDASKIQTIERFSDAYFKLISENTTDENAVLSRQKQGEEFIVMFRGQYYRIR